MCRTDFTYAEVPTKRDDFRKHADCHRKKRATSHKNRNPSVTAEAEADGGTAWMRPIRPKLGTMQR